jgi:hypothetical protein
MAYSIHTDESMCRTAILDRYPGIGEKGDWTSFFNGVENIFNLHFAKAVSISFYRD